MKKRKIFTLVLSIMFLLIVVSEKIVIAKAEDTKKVIEIALGYQNSAAILEDGSLWMWGNNRWGQLGDGTTIDQYSPIKVMDNVKKIAIGGNNQTSYFGVFCAAVKNDGTLWTWGENSDGLFLGDDTGTSRSIPVKIMDDVEDVSVGMCCAVLKKDGSLWTWGYNSSGQLGDNSTTNRKLPQKVMEGVKKVEVAGSKIAAIKEDGSLWTWGWAGNNSEQLGDEFRKDRSIPIKIMDDVKDIGIGFTRSAAIKNDGSLWVWGVGGNGLGDGIGETKKTPVKIMENVKDICYGMDNFGFAVKEDGSLWGWGNNEKGQLGNGTIASEDFPVKILDDVKQVKSLSYHTAIIKNDGSMWIWGLNKEGQLGNGTTLYSIIPEKVSFVENSNSNKIIDFFSLNQTATSTLDTVATFQGTLKLSDKIEEPSSILVNEASLIQWKSSDQSIVQDNEISCIATNSNENHSANLVISFTPYRKGTVIITGTTSNGLTASCEVTVLDNVGITIEQTKIGTEGKTIALSGKIILDEANASQENLTRIINNLSFTTTDTAVAKVLNWSGIQSFDHKTAELTIWTTLYKPGTVTITASMEGGSKSECQLTIEADTSQDNMNYSDDYSSKISEILMNKGTFNVVKYLRNNSNYTASSFVYEKDSKFGSKLSMFVTNVGYRGWDGWKDLLDGSTSVKEAEKILASLLSVYQSDCEALSRVQKAEKYAKMINNAFLDFSKTNNMLEGLNSVEIATVTEYFSESNIAELLYKEEYDKLMVAPGIAMIHGQETPEAWNKLMEGFFQSAEMSKALKDGMNKIGGGLEDLGKSLEYLSLTQDTVNYMYRLESLMQANDMYCEMLLYVKENCKYSIVQEAAINLYYTIQEKEVMIIGDILEQAINLSGEKSLDFVIETACVKCPALLIIKSGYDWGVTISNTFFKTASTQELKDALRTEAFLAECLAKWMTEKEQMYYESIGTSQEQENAKEFYYSIYMLWQTRMCAEETLQSLLETIGTAGPHSGNYVVSVKILNALRSYKNGIFSEENIADLIGISVECPVDVEIYDTLGRKVLLIEDGIESSGYKDGIYYYCSYNPLDDDYVKYIYFDKNAGYNIKVVGNELGLVNSSIFSISDEGELKENYFENVVVEENTSIHLENIVSENVGYTVTNPNSIESKTYVMENRSAKKVIATSLILSETSFEMLKGEKKILTATILPTNATNQKVIWKTSNNNIISINNDGVITAIENGTAIITASVDNLVQKCEITVKEYISDDNSSFSETDKIPPDIPVENPISLCEIVLPYTEVSYTGKAKKPSVTVKYGEFVLKKGRDYKVTYSNNKKLGTAKVIITGIGEYKGTIEKTFDIVLKKPTIKNVSNSSNSVVIKWNKITGAKGYYIYRKTGTNGKWKKVKKITKVDTISWKDKDVKNGVRYAYKVCAYKGKVTSSKSAAKVVYYLKKPSIQSLKLMVGKKAVLKYSENKKATGYQIQYSTSKQFAKSKTKTIYVKNKATLSKTLSSLKTGKTYYVRIRTYKTVDSTKYYSSWSTKSLKVK